MEDNTVKSSGTNTSRFTLTEAGDFVITEYNSSRPFSSFLPGIAGVNGIPLWAFYVNRGQCICSVGVRDKDHPILEFHPANRAYDLVTRQGFRTFLKLTGDLPTEYYEPFQRHYRDRGLYRDQRMIVSPSQLILEEYNHSLNLKFTVEYLPVPQDTYAGLVRTLRIENIGSAAISLEGLDGLPIVVPYGVDNHCLKNMRKTIEAFVEVRNTDRKAPFFRAKVEAADRPDVLAIAKGNFYLGYVASEVQAELVSPVVDPSRIFGWQTDFSFPERYLSQPLDELHDNQILEGRLPCAMGTFSTTLSATESITYTSIIGHASSISTLNEMLPRITTRRYIEKKKSTNRQVIGQINQKNFLCSSEPRLDLYARQNVLDNTLRGGLPITLSGSDARTTIHVYSRKHGDLERDYNDFCVMPTQYSQGNGNFRDVNQNRRSDLLLNPDVDAGNVEQFYNLIQLDGFNPLIVNEVHFEVGNQEQVNRVLTDFLGGNHAREVATFLSKPFTPGALLSFIGEQEMEPITDSNAFLGELLEHCHKVALTKHGEGFWIDHWTYNLDLLENFRAVFPDRFEDLLFDARRFCFYDSVHRVQPRDHKYVLRSGMPVQLNAVVYDDAKAALIEDRSSDQNLTRVNHGRGTVFRTSLLCKLLCLVANKLASLDSDGVGVEMEAGKPGWYDALNGLPGLFGSSVCETLEIKRHILFLIEQLSEYGNGHEEILLFEELTVLMKLLNDLLEANTPSFKFWDSAAQAREDFRDKTRFGIGGNETLVSSEWLRGFLALALKKLNAGIERARDPKSQTIFTYFQYQVEDYEVINTPDSEAEGQQTRFDDGLVNIRPLKFRRVPLPLFLEGPVHYLRCIPEESEARRFATAVKRSELFDESLQMYKVNASLADEPMEIGRAKVFSPGWLENESIWLHMEYKYMLELLRNRLYDEFYEDFRRVFVPFLDPEIYGRSILENCSFLVSSAHPDPAVHGGAFVARLSGATAEFMHILSLMVFGPRPFQIDANGHLGLYLRPVLPDWLFTKTERTVPLMKDDGIREIVFARRTFSFMFLGEILVCYHNPESKNTYGERSVTPSVWRVTGLNGTVQTYSGDFLEGDIVRRIRERNVDRIDIELR